jgi:hypothetical protein
MLCMTVLASSSAEVSSWVHPGVLVSPSRLAYIKDQCLNARPGPVFDAYKKALRSQYARLDWSPHGPPASGTIECGSYSRPDFGCTNESTDTSSAYLQALLFAINGTQRYAENAIAVLNVYAAGLHKYSNSNAPLQAGWSMMFYTKAAELLKHTGAPWPEEEQRALSAMLNRVSLPLVYGGSGANGNWELSMLDGMIGLAVLDENATLFDHAVAFWRQRLPSYFWAHADGAHPEHVPRGHSVWNGTCHNETGGVTRACSGTFYGQGVFNASTDGVCQETCRDLGHLQLGLASAHNLAETAFVQGVDLWAEEEARLSASMELHSRLLLTDGRTPAPTYFCAGAGVKGTDNTSPTMEVGYHAFARRGLHHALPLTAKHLETQVRADPDPAHVRAMSYETLTHGGGGDA